jgi:hypothetical protein
MLAAALARMVRKNARHRKASKLGSQPNEAFDFRPRLRIEFLKRDLTDNAVSGITPRVHFLSHSSPKTQHETGPYQLTPRHTQVLQDHRSRQSVAVCVRHCMPHLTPIIAVPSAPSRLLFPQPALF